MATAKLESRIGTLTARLDDLAGRMEEIAARYLSGMEGWLRKRFEREVSEAVASAPDTALLLGHGGLARLKGELDDLEGSLPDLIGKRAGTPGAWPHLWDRDSALFPAGLYGAAPGKGAHREPVVPDHLRVRLGVVLGAVARVLARNGFEAYARRHWDRAYVRSDYFPPEYLSGDLAGHETLMPILSEYAALYDEYSALIGDLQGADRDLAVAGAKDLWKHA
jgi:hypothetical protein